MVKESNKKMLDISSTDTNGSNNIIQEKPNKADILFNEPTKHILHKLLQETIAALQEYTDPLSINVGELLNQLDILQKTITQESDIFRVILLISALTDLREKQDSHIMQLLRGNMEILDKLLFQAFYQILHMPDIHLYHIGKKILQQNGCYKQPIVSRKYIPSNNLEPKLISIPYTEMLEQINWTIPQATNQVLYPEQEIKPVQIFKSKQKGHFQWKDELDILYQILPDNAIINVYEWVIQPTYQESLKRLQAMSYFIAKNRVILLTNNTKNDLEKYQAKKNSKTEIPEHRILKGEALVFNLTYSLWKYYISAKGNQSELKMEVIHE